MDQHRSSVPKNQEPFRSSKKPNLTAKNDIQKARATAGHVDIIAMVRSLQRAAGMTDCFRQGNADCDIIDCDWRTYCLDNSVDPRKNGKSGQLE
jgi:hypothetical protein